MKSKLRLINQPTKKVFLLILACLLPFFFTKQFGLQQYTTNSFIFTVIKSIETISVPNSMQLGFGLLY